MNPEMGSLIGGVFGLIYVVANAGQLPSGAATTLRVLAIAAGSAILSGPLGASSAMIAALGGVAPGVVLLAAGYRGVARTA
jgi:hypothetical protein